MNQAAFVSEFGFPLSALPAAITVNSLNPSQICLCGRMLYPGRRLAIKPIGKARSFLAQVRPIRLDQPPKAIELF